MLIFINYIYFIGFAIDFSQLDNQALISCPSAWICLTGAATPVRKLESYLKEHTINAFPSKQYTT